MPGPPVPISVLSVLNTGVSIHIRVPETGEGPSVPPTLRSTPSLSSQSTGRSGVGTVKGISQGRTAARSRG